MEIKRDVYLNRLIAREGNGFIKVITGIRRCGKSYMMITGEVSAVEASIDRAKELVAAKGMYLDSSVIAHPDRRMIDSIL